MMSGAKRFQQKYFTLYTMQKLTTVLMLAALVAGLLPPPLVSSAVNATLPETVARPVAAASQAFLPAPKAAQAADLPPVAQQKLPFESAPAAPVAKPLTQGVTGSNVLTITKTVVGTGSGPFNLTVTGPNGYVNNASITPGTPVVLSGLASGVYTVTESSPGTGWTTVYTATASAGSATGGSTNAVVTLQNNSNTATLAVTPITGIVFHDYNSNGVMDTTGVAPNLAIDSGVSGVTVTAYDKNGNAVGSTTSAANGAYTLTPTGIGPYRVEFTTLPSGYESTTHGTGNGTSTQFVTSAGGASNVNLGINQPCDYCQNSPTLAANIYAYGNQLGAQPNPVPPNSGTVNYSAQTVLASFPYNAGSSSTSTYPGTYFSPTPTVEAQAGEIGTTWGLAYDRTTKRLFAAAFMKRHAGYAAGGPGAIYVINAVTHNPIQTFTVPGATTDAHDSTNWAKDNGNTGWDAVGKTALGGLAMADDGSALFVMNLENRTLYKLNPTTGSVVASQAVPLTTLPTPAGSATNCAANDVRPFAVAYYAQTLYVGIICSAESTNAAKDLFAYVYQVDPMTLQFGATPYFRASLNYLRNGRPNDQTADSTWRATWKPWSTTFKTNVYKASLPNDWATSYPQPMLTDIAFDRGNLILGIRDRSGDQVGTVSFSNPARPSQGTLAYAAGDTVRACGNPLTLENNAVCDVTTAGVNSGATANQGPGGKEFYYQDDWAGYHDEVSLGGLAQIAGYSQVAVSTYDPPLLGGNFGNGNDPSYSIGPRWFNNTTGKSDRGYIIADYTGSLQNTFSKANGMGDLVALCDPAPLEIGNRVWNDINGNGVQDPGEPGLSGLTVSLQGPTNTVTTNTDANGLYYFNVNRNTAYTLTVTPPSGYSVTVANVSALSGASATSNAAISDTIDSDAVLVGGKATIYYTTGSAGQNNHGLDFGFTQPVTGKAGIVNTEPGSIQVTKQVATTDGSSPTMAGSFTFNVNCGGANVSPSSSQAVAAGGSVTFSNIPAGAVCTVSEATNNLPTAPSGYTWVSAQVSSTSVTVAAGQTTQVTAKNTLAPQPTATNVLTVTKTISGTGTGPFNITVSGPGGYISTTTINGGQTKLFTGLAQGVYTVTESTPAGWTAVYTATPGTGGSTNAVVTLQNSNTVTLATTPITGTVFRDYNSDGQITANGVVTDTGVSGVIITVYDKNGNSVGSATSAADGTYTINPTSAGPYRVEFSNLPSGYEPTTHGTGNGTSTQFVTTAGGASNVNLGINIPEDYSQANPRIAIPLHTAGAITPTNTAVRALFSFTYDAPKTGDSTGIPNMLQTGSGVENPTTDATQGQIGATWGLGYDRQGKRLFAAAVLQRQVGLGPLGLGGIYVVDYNNGVGNYVGSFTLQGVTPANDGSAIDLGSVTRVIVSGAGTSGTANGLNDDPTQPSKDIDAFAKVGKVGYGDIDMDSTRGTLWAVNLNQRALISIDVHNYTPLTNGPVPGTVNQYLLSNLSGVPTCTNGVFRPWALRLYHGAGYLGGVCSAENAAASGTYGFSDITFYVLKFDPTNPSAGFTTVASAANYNHAEEASLYHKWCDDPQANASQTACDYQLDGAFRNVPQPILTDVEFREDGSLIAGIADRYTMQQMTRNYDARSGTGTLLSTKSSGDLIFWCKQGNSYVLEGSAGCAVNDPSTAPDAKLTTSPLVWLTTDGLNGTGEFFQGDWFVGNPSASLGQAQHNETATGGLALLPGAQQVLSTSADPVSYVDTDPSGGFGTQGVRWFSTQTGTRTASYQLIDYPYNTFNTPPLFAKGNGLGDLELLSDPAPIEIGNRIWNDLNGNGMQDPSEPGLSGLTINLVNSSGTVLSSTVTSGSGNYYFGNLRPNTAYTVTLTPPSGYSLTAANAAALSGASATSNNAISDTIDSDAVLVSGNATIYYTTGSAGQNNHGLDFGFTQPVSGQVDILNVAPVPVPNPGGFSLSKEIVTTDGSEPPASGLFPVIVNCAGVSGYPATVQLNADGTPVTVGNLANGTTCTFSEDTNHLPVAPSGYTWVNAQISPASITIVSDVTATVTAKNSLAPQPTLPTNMLTVTKTISGTGTGPFNITVTGPSGYISTTTINGGQTKLFTGLASGVYTVTESTPAGWTTVYTATPGTGGSSHAVVNLSNASSVTPVTPGAISGTVYQDYNSNGQMNTASGAAIDVGIAGVTVTAYDQNGSACGNTTSGATGQYSFTPTCSGPWRLVFSTLPAGYEPSTHGASNGTNVQFVATSGATNVNFGINKPCDYCQAAPRLVVNRFSVGSHLNNTDATVISQAYTANGSHTNQIKSEALASQVGATWGLAYHRASKSVFVASYTKRIADYGPGSGQPTSDGTGTIYRVIPGSASSNGVPFVDLDDLFGATTTGINPHTDFDYTNNDGDFDKGTFAAVGKVALGDLDISEDDTTLWVINLANRKLYKLPIGATTTPVAPTAAQISSYQTPDPGCVNGVARPFGLKVYNGLVYVGGVCTAENGGSASNLLAYVYSFDPVSTTWSSAPVLQFPLNYTRQCADADPSYPVASTCIDVTGATTQGAPATWHPWTDVLASTTFPQASIGEGVYAEPMLTDIEFVGNDMVVGLRDRFADQMGNNEPGPDENANPLYIGISAGDILRASPNGAGGWNIEQNGKSNPLGSFTSSNGVGNQQGPGGGEFYSGEQFSPFHTETSLGGLAQVPGFAEIVTTAFDPASFVYVAGTLQMNNQTGNKVRGFELDTNSSNFFGKANGLGDVEALCDPAPIEIGNRVWNDINGNGVQDPGEPGLNGLTINLVNSSGTVLSSTVTSGSGNYYFGNLRPNTAYTVTLTPPSGYSLTAANAAALSGASATSNNAISDTIDSDAVVVNGKATIYYTTGSAGQNNHGLDFGFTKPVTGQAGILNIAPVKIGNRLWIETDSDGDATTGTVTPVASQVVTATSSSGKVYTATTDSNGYYTITVPANTVYTVTTAVPAGTTPSAVITPVATDANAAANDNKNHLNTGTTVTVANTDNLSVDFGFHLVVVKIGNRLWIESDSDGDATTGTVTPVVGQVVTATSSSGKVYTATTDTNGYYTLTVPANAVYTVTTGTPAGTVASTVSASVATDANATANDNKNHLNTGTTVTVANTDNLSVDFGFHTPKAQFGDRVWLESDDDGLASTGLITPVVGMVMTATAGVNVYTATTNSQGYYSFTVTPGSYTVTHGPVPASYGSVRASQGVVGSAILSGNAGAYTQSGNPDGNHPQNTRVTVADGEANWQVDYAFSYPRADLSVSKTVDKTRAVRGDTLTYTIVLTNHGPDAATSVQLIDLLPAGVTWVSDSGAGAYDHTTGLWTLNQLAANTSATLTITVTVN